MASILLKLADLGFTAHGCYRQGECESCKANNLLTWYWHQRWMCDDCVLNHLFPRDDSNIPKANSPIEDSPSDTEVAV